MFERELMINSLRKQHGHLNELISHLETCSRFSSSDYELYGERTKQIEKNLRTLRKLKNNYAQYLFQ